MGRWPPQQRLRRRRSRGRLSRLVLVVAVLSMAFLSASAQEAGVDAVPADGTDGSAVVGDTDGSTGTTEAPAATDAATTVDPEAETPLPTAETPVPTEATPVPTEAPPTPTTVAPTEAPVPTTEAPVETLVPTTSPPETAAPVPTTDAPTEIPTTEPPTEAPTSTPVTDVPVATTAAPEETKSPTPITPAPAATTAAPTPTTAVPAKTPPAASRTPTPTPRETPAPTAATKAPVSSSSGASTSGPQTSDSSTYKSATSDESGAGTVAPADLTTLSPISDDSDADKATAGGSGSKSSVGASTSSASASTLGTWQIALIVAGVLVAVVASLFFVRFQNSRGRVFKRARGSSQQRALDSFFRQNRVTLMSSGHNSASQLAFNTTRNGGHSSAPLTPPEQIPTTSLGPREVTPTATAATFRPRGRTADVIAGPAADMFSRDTTRSAMSSARSYSGGDFDSFIGQSYGESNHSSSVYQTSSERSDSIVDGSLASTANRSTRRFLSRHMSSGGEPSRATGRSDRSSSDFSVFNSSADSLDDSSPSFVSIALPSATVNSPRPVSGRFRGDSDSSAGNESFLSRASSYGRDSYDSYGVASGPSYRSSEMSEGEI